MIYSASFLQKRQAVLRHYSCLLGRQPEIMELFGNVQMSSDESFTDRGLGVALCGTTQRVSLLHVFPPLMARSPILSVEWGRDPWSGPQRKLMLWPAPGLWTCWSSLDPLACIQLFAHETERCSRAANSLDGQQALVWLRDTSTGAPGSAWKVAGVPVPTAHCSQADQWTEVRTTHT